MKKLLFIAVLFGSIVVHAESCKTGGALQPNGYCYYLELDNRTSHPTKWTITRGLDPFYFETVAPKTLADVGDQVSIFTGGALQPFLYELNKDGAEISGKIDCPSVMTPGDVPSELHIIYKVSSYKDSANNVNYACDVSVYHDRAVHRNTPL